MLIAVISDTHMPRGARLLRGACLERLQGADAAASPTPTLWVSMAGA